MIRITIEVLRALVLAAACAGIASCTALSGDRESGKEPAESEAAPATASGEVSDVGPGGGARPILPSAGPDSAAAGSGTQLGTMLIDQVSGTGRFIDPEAASRTGYRAPSEGDVTLNFDGADISVVAKTILGDLLRSNYVIDPKVTGQVTLQTSRPLAKDALIPVLESLLNVHDAALVKEGDFYKIVPKASALSSIMAPRLRPTRDRGFQVVVVPLRYVAAEDMHRILTDLKVGKEAVQADPRRNLLILSGSETTLRQLLETIEIFDVDQFQGMSMALFRLRYLDSVQMIEELKQVVGPDKDSPLLNMVRFMAIERLNALLVVSSQPKYLDYLREWIERLDRSDLVAGMRLYVYQVKNRDAVSLAEVLQQLFPEEAGETAERRPERALAPGVPEKRAELPRVGEAGLQKRLAPPRPEVAPAATAAGLGVGVGAVKFIADEVNNALIVMATAEDYARVEGAIRQLDVLPLQVLIEATIVEVILRGDLRYGVEWFFKNNNVIDKGNDKQGRGLLDLGQEGIGALVPGFSYSIVDANEVVRAVLNALAEDSLLEVLSSPSLMVLDNQAAEINVGDQVPVNTESATTEGGVIIESIQYKDTGVLLTVRPRVNAGGLVTMEVTQEVTNVGEIDSATGQRSFLQRKINSMVAVKSGQTIVLGGLITENKATTESGVPVLYKVPVLGKLFGRTTTTDDRRELLVLLTPQVVDDMEDTTEILNEFRDKMPNLQIDTTGATIRQVY